MSMVIAQGNARELPLEDNSVDLICTSPPYWKLRDYRDGGESLAGQIGAEDNPRQYVASLLACTAEWMRVLKPTGSLFVNLGDKYASRWASRSEGGGLHHIRGRDARGGRNTTSVPDKSLLGLPWRYALGCVDELGLILRQDLVDDDDGGAYVWSKPNGIPESVTDRCRRAHEYVFHLVKQPRYFSAVDEIREPHSDSSRRRAAPHRADPGRAMREGRAFVGTNVNPQTFSIERMLHPLGRLPGSVWEIPTQPLDVPARVAHARCCGGEPRPGCQDGLGHYACVDAETEILTRRGWLRHEELRDDDEVAGYDLDSGLARWTRLHGIHRYDYDGELVSAEARGLSMRLTPNHRTLAHRHAGVHSLRQPLEVLRADALTNRHSIPRAIEWAHDLDGKSIGADLAALCGWVAAEGWYGPHHAVWLSQSATANPAKVAEIDALFERLGEWPGRPAARNISRARNGRWRVTVQADGITRRTTVATEAEALTLAAQWRRELALGGTRRAERRRLYRGQPWTDVRWRLAHALGAEIRRLMPSKVLPAWFADLPLDEAQAVLEAFIAGDGHDRADGRRAIFQKHRTNLDVMQAIAVRCGYNTTLRKSGGRWVLYLNPPRPARLRQADNTSLVGREHYKGIVWCPTTGTGTFIARRNGSVFVTGNSFPLELPRRIILGWSPIGICTICGEGRRPVAVPTGELGRHPGGGGTYRAIRPAGARDTNLADAALRPRSIVGYACACTAYTDHPGTDDRDLDVPQRWTAKNTPLSGGGFAGNGRDAVRTWREYHLEGWEAPPTRPALVVDPFAGTGTTLLVADALGRDSIGFDLSADYCGLARWRTADPGERARAMGVPKPPPVPPDQDFLFDLGEVGA